MAQFTFGLTSLIRGHEFIIEPSVTYIGGLIWLAVVSSVGSFTAYLLLVGSIGPDEPVTRPLSFRSLP